MLRELQRSFRRALLDREDRSVLAQIVSDGIAAEDRFGVYRSNLFASLTGVLETAYPMLPRLVGEPFFRQAAAGYVRHRLPRLPQLSAYGDSFAAYLASLPQIAAAPFVPDVARLDWARHEAFFAPSGDAPDRERLSGIPSEALTHIRFKLRPSVRLVASHYPIVTIWAHAASTDQPLDLRKLATGGEHALVLRIGATPVHVTVEPGEFTFLLALSAGATLVQAAHAASETAASFDLQACLVRNLTRGTFAALSIHESPQEH